MAWQRRGNHFYYYRSTKEKGQVTTDYLGAGSRALQAATEDKERQAGHTTARIAQAGQSTDVTQ